MGEYAWIYVKHYLPKYAQVLNVIEIISGSSTAATYVQRWVLCINCPPNVQVSVKRVEVVVRS